MKDNVHLKEQKPELDEVIQRLRKNYSYGARSFRIPSDEILDPSMIEASRSPYHDLSHECSPKKQWFNG